MLRRGAAGSHSTALRAVVQVYTDGDQCALLPRRTSVALLCGADDFKVGELAEPSTCNYTLSFWVPVRRMLLLASKVAALLLPCLFDLTTTIGL